MTVIDGLLPEEYQQVIAPALKAAADLAAARGDPYLFNDLPSMLTLMVLVKGFADRYQDQWGALGQASPRETFMQAPQAACVMVLTEYELDPESISHMQVALVKAFETLLNANVFGPESAQMEKAWQAQLQNKSELRDAHLRQAATITAAAIDAWEQKRQAN